MVAWRLALEGFPSGGVASAGPCGVVSVDEFKNALKAEPPAAVHGSSVGCVKPDHISSSGTHPFKKGISDGPTSNLATTH